MRVEDVMTEEVVCLSPTDSLKEAAEALRGSGISGAPVTEDGGLVGVLSEGDIVEQLKTSDLEYDLWLPSPFEVIEIPVRNAVKWREFREEMEDVSELHVSDAMTSEAKTARPGDSAEDAAEKMARLRINRLPVVEEGEVVGIVTREDLLRGLFD